MMALLASVCPDVSLPDVRLEHVGTFARRQDPQAAEPRDAGGKITLRKDGGPAAGPDKPYSVRETGASDLQEFVGGKQVVFIEPYDFFFLFFLVGLVVVILIIL
jgi:hypothetical protein